MQMLPCQNITLLREKDVLKYFKKVEKAIMEN